MRFGVLDLETTDSAEDVGGWGYAYWMGISVGVLYDSQIDAYKPFCEGAVPKLLAHLVKLDAVVGYNTVKFDYTVLGGNLPFGCEFDFRRLKTVDLFQALLSVTGRFISLQAVASATLGKGKSSDGLEAIRMWNRGEFQELEEYCRVDVELTRDLYLHALQHGSLSYLDKSGGRHTVAIPGRLLEPVHA